MPSAIPLSQYRFIARSGTATLTGALYDSRGFLIGDYLSLSVNSTELQTLANLLGGDIPAGAVMFDPGETSADLVITTERKDGTTGIVALAKTRAKYHPAGQLNFTLGVRG